MPRAAASVNPTPGAPESPPGGRSRRVRFSLPAALLAISLLYLGALGILGAGYGPHWDEGLLLDSVRHSAETGLLLPRWYNYPSVSYDVALLSALPDVVADAAHWYSPDRAGLGSRELLERLRADAFKRRVRVVFFLLCLLAAVPVYLLGGRLAGNRWIGLFAALTMVSAWEFVYQARWIAPDGLVAMFVAWSLWSQSRVLAEADEDRRRPWIGIAAIFAGLAMGTKYPAALVLVPLVIAVLLGPKPPELGRFARWKQALLALAIATLVFVLVSPGCLLEPTEFVRDVLHEMRHYADSHGGSTVTPGWDSISKLATYLGIVFLSRSVAVAAAFTGLTLWGAIRFLRERRREALWLLALPALYLVEMASQHVMIVRNDLILLPFFAVLAGLGLADLGRRAGGRPVLRGAIAAAAALTIVFHLGVATRSSWSIAHPGTETKLAALTKRLAAAPRTRFHLSPRVRALLGDSTAAVPANVVGSLGQADRFIFLSDEVQHWETFAANRHGLYRSLWAPQDDVNWDYYPTWVGSPRMLEIPARAIRSY